MPNALILAPLLLAAVYIVSALAKLRDRASVDRAFADLQVPAALSAPWIRRVFPWAELALGIALVLVPWPLSVLVALAALALSALYWWLIAAAFRRPEPVSCGCFGSVAPDRVDGVTLARNTTLVLLAVLAIVDAVDPVPILVRLYTTDAGWWVLGLAVAAWLAFAILRPGAPSPRPDAASAHPAAPGAVAARTGGGTAEDDEVEDYVRLPIPYGSLQLPQGGSVTLRDLARQRPQLLIWLSLTCGSCQTVLAELPSWHGTLGPVEIHPVLWSLDQVGGHAGLDGVLGDANYDTQRLFDTGGTPSAVLLGADGLLAGGPVVGATAVLQLVADIREELGAADLLDGADALRASGAAEPVVVSGEVTDVAGGSRGATASSRLAERTQASSAGEGGGQDGGGFEWYSRV